MQLIRNHQIGIKEESSQFRIMVPTSSWVRTFITSAHPTKHDQYEELVLDTKGVGSVTHAGWFHPRGNRPCAGRGNEYCFQSPPVMACLPSLWGHLDLWSEYLEDNKHPRY